MTTVCFRIEENGEVLAVFPYQLARKGDFNTITTYAHNGQHSVSGWEYLRYCTKPARAEQYAELLAELRAIGYTDLKIVSRLPNWYAIVTRAITRYWED